MGGSVVSSAERSRWYEKARAAFEMAEARVAMLQAAEEMAAGSQTGSVGRRLEDVRSDTGSSGPSPPIRETAKENPRRLLRQFFLLRPIMIYFRKRERERYTLSTKSVFRAHQ